jgi:polar amino acid transport system substrate-binding protein
MWRRIFAGLLLLLVACSGHSAKGKIYKIGRDVTWYPRNFMGQAPAITAFSDDLCTMIAQQEQCGFYLYSASWDSLFTMLDKGEFDGVLGSLPLTPETRERYDTSDPYLLIGPVLVVPQDSSVDALSQMEGKIVGFGTDGAAERAATQIPRVVMRPYNNVALALDDLMNEKIDGVIIEVLIAQRFCRDLYAGQLKIVTPPLNDDALRLFADKGEHEELIRAFNEGLKAIQANGEYAVAEKKWGIID